MRKEVVTEIIKSISLLFFLWYTLDRLENSKNNDNIILSIVFFISVIVLTFFEFYFFKKRKRLYLLVLFILWLVPFWYFFLGYFSSPLISILDKISLFLFNLSLLSYIFYAFFKKEKIKKTDSANLQSMPK